MSAFIYLFYRYRTYMRPRYKVAYKMVTEMEWKCCHGYSGEDCNDGPNGGSDTQISTSRPWPRPSQPGQTGTGTGHGQGGGNGKSMFSLTIGAFTWSIAFRLQTV